VGKTQIERRKHRLKVMLPHFNDDQIRISSSLLRFWQILGNKMEGYGSAASEGLLLVQIPTLISKMNSNAVAHLGEFINCFEEGPVQVDKFHAINTEFNNLVDLTNKREVNDIYNRRSFHFRKDLSASTPPMTEVPSAFVSPKSSPPIIIKSDTKP